MTEPRDDSLDRLLRETLRPAPDAGETDSCLDAETMAAWVDDGLSGAALAAAEAHAATCPRCRAMAAVIVRSQTAEQSPAQVSFAAPRPRKWVPWLVPLAAAAIVALAIWIPRRAQQPAEESTIALAPSAPEIAPQLAPSEPVGQRQEAPARRDEPPTAAKETGPAAPTPALGAAATAVSAPPSPPIATPSQRAAAPPSPPPPASAPVMTPPVSTAAVTVVDRDLVPSTNAAAPLAFERSAAEIVLAEFQSPDVLAQAAQAGAAGGGGGRGGRGAPAGQATAAAPPVVAGGGGGGAAAAPAAGAGGRGGAGRGGATFRTAPVEGSVTPNPSTPTRWRVLASGIVERSNPPGAPWAPVAIDPPGARVTGGAAPSSLVCWLVGRSGLVLLTIDGRTFTRIAFPDAADLASVRATSAREAVVTTTDGRRFETRDGGQTWSRN